MDFMEMGFEVMDWTHLAQEMVQWQTLVHTIMSLLSPQKGRGRCFLGDWATVTT
jgi:hypothetical protein